MKLRCRSIALVLAVAMAAACAERPPPAPTAPPPVAGPEPTPPPEPEEPPPAVEGEGAEAEPSVGAALTAPWGELDLTRVDPRPGDDPVEIAFELLGRDRTLLGYPKDFKPRDPWRLSIVDELLADPLAGVELLDAPAPGLDLHRWLDRARAQLDLEAASAAATCGGDATSTGLDAAALRRAAPAGSAWRADPAWLTSLADALESLAPLLARAEACARPAFAATAPSDRALLEAMSKGLPIGFAPQNLDRLFAVLERVDLAPAIDAGEMLIDGLRELERRMRALAPPPAGARGDWPPLTLELEGGVVRIGGPDADVHDGPALAVIDLGGDDVYLGVKPPAGASVGLVLDLAGDDVHRADQGGSAGTGLLGVSVLLDAAGDDVYSAAGPGPAAAVGGFGTLLDLAGDDRYAAGRMSQGAAMAGVALLVDEAGDDDYELSVFGQGFGAAGGFGLLLDGAGDDRYAAGLVHPDHREPLAAFHSFAQGYAMGIRELTETQDRNRASGGVGWLEDLGGDDVYLASYFGQGAAYWYGLGALVDRAGDDRYVARRYAQGAGVHAAVGLLLDGSGSDAYLSWGVSQGVGHDLAVGLLRDRAGDDAYRGEWLLQGVGNENGVGLLLDDAGDDRFEATAAEAQGWAGLSRGAIGIGWLLDAGGEDRFVGPHAAEPPIWVRGRYGLGVVLGDP